MITLLSYKCSVCGAVYDSEKKCMECEACHEMPTGFNGFKYCEGESYPTEIEVDFGNSFTSVVYRRRDF